jgi:hypothetical protein
MKLKKEGLPVDCITPEAAIYLTIKVDAAGRKTADGKILETQGDVTAYILTSWFGSCSILCIWQQSYNPWYRLSVGTCKKEEINEMIEKLGDALRKLQ